MNRAKIKRCIGFGEHRGKCRRVPESPSGYWCARCEALRRAAVSAGFDALRTRFEQAPKKKKEEL